MPYPETTDAFAVTDIKNWSTFKRQEVSGVHKPPAIGPY